jgi:hypothetical protein
MIVIPQTSRASGGMRGDIAPIRAQLSSRFHDPLNT